MRCQVQWCTAPIPTQHPVRSVITQGDKKSVPQQQLETRSGLSVCDASVQAAGACFRGQAADGATREGGKAPSGHSGMVGWAQKLVAVRTQVSNGYQFQPGGFKVTPEIKAEFDTNGFIVIRNLLNEAELKKIKGVLEESDVIKEYALNLSDGSDKESRMCLWNQPGNDVTGMVARSEKVAGTCEKLLGGEVYHYHTKLMMKEAYTGGRFVWHQDYGYWYGNTCLFPDMMTVFIAMDPCRQDNGCLQVLQGSSRCGRIEHKKIGGQMGAVPERLDMLKTVCPLVSVEMDPGDALFFHCNLLHSSSQNLGPNRRWAFLCAYNRADNNPIKEHIHPRYSKLSKVPDSAILDCTKAWDVENKDFFTQQKRDNYWNRRTEPEFENYSK